MSRVRYQVDRAAILGGEYRYPETPFEMDEYVPPKGKKWPEWLHVLDGDYSFPVKRQPQEDETFDVTPVPAAVPDKARVKNKKAAKRGKAKGKANTSAPGPTTEDVLAGNQVMAHEVTAEDLGM